MGSTSRGVDGQPTSHFRSAAHARPLLRSLLRTTGWLLSKSARLLAWTSERRRRVAPDLIVAAMLGSVLLASGHATAQDTPANIISDQIRRQGFPCDEPRQARRDEQASRPNGAVWIMHCANVAYRVTLIPDMAAKVELIK